MRLSCLSHAHSNPDGGKSICRSSPNDVEQANVREKRDKWKEEQEKLVAEKLRFLDQSSVNLGMTRLYGCALTSQRVEEYVPDVPIKSKSYAL